MTAPPNELKDWTYDTLLTTCGWFVVEGLMQGMSLRDCMRKVVNTVIVWQREQPRARR